MAYLTRDDLELIRKYIAKTGVKDSELPELDLETNDAYVSIVSEGKNYKIKVSNLITSGAEGKNAYEIAVANGFLGTQEEWLDSLTGMSAYEIAVSQGFLGTEREWLDFLANSSLDNDTLNYYISQILSEVKSTAYLTQSQYDALEYINNEGAYIIRDSETNEMIRIYIGRVKVYENELLNVNALNLGGQWLEVTI